ncbi:hypothetical protein [Helicobacter sp. 23-1045]
MRGEGKFEIFRLFHSLKMTNLKANSQNLKINVDCHDLHSQVSQ